MSVSEREDRLPRRVRHPLRFRVVQVRRTEQVSPTVLRVIFEGDELEAFYSPGFDDHVKLIFPDPETGEIVCPKVGPDGPIWPQGPRPIMRDYTPRAYDTIARTLTVDFALHDAGPATAWALAAKPGDRLGVGGPRGSMMLPDDYGFNLLMGDETALPAIARRLEALDPAVKAHVVIEVDSLASRIDLPVREQVCVVWATRDGDVPGESQVLMRELDALSLTDPDLFVWIGCESSMARALRLALRARGVPVNRIKAAGYWRRGVQASHETIDD